MPLKLITEKAANLISLEVEQVPIKIENQKFHTITQYKIDPFKTAIMTLDQEISNYEPMTMKGFPKSKVFKYKCPKKQFNKRIPITAWG